MPSVDTALDCRDTFILDRVRLQEHVSLAPYTTLQIGGQARFFVAAASEEDLLEAVRFSRSLNVPLFTLGGGSNVVVPDEGFAGVVLHAVIGHSVLAESVDGGTILHADAGLDWDEFVLHACKLGFSGVECLAGIPGLVGGAPIQNIGAYGQEVASTIRGVRALDLSTLEMVSLKHQDCAFGYRSSIFNSSQRGRYIVTHVSFFFADGAKPNLTYKDLAPLTKTHPSGMDIYRFVRTVRAGKGMLIDPAKPVPDSRSVGSFFKNPLVEEPVFQELSDRCSLPPGDIPHWRQESGGVKLAAAWLIEQAGFAKGFSLGRAGISTRHSLALINRSGDATCADLLALRDFIAREVHHRFGVSLEQEPVMLR